MVPRAGKEKGGKGTEQDSKPFSSNKCKTCECGIKLLELLSLGDIREERGEEKSCKIGGERALALGLSKCRVKSHPKSQTDNKIRVCHAAGCSVAQELVAALA